MLATVANFERTHEGADVSNLTDKNINLSLTHSRMSDSDNEAANQMEDEEREREERNQIWSCFMQYDVEQ